MKNFLTPFILGVFILFSLWNNLYAQAPQKINYQAVARNLTGVPLINTSINVTYEIRQSTSSGAAVYRETHTPTTNQFGLFNLEIGGGTPVLGTFAGINWSTGLYYLYIEVNGNPMLPATQLLSVPYALHANTAASGTPGADGLNCWDTNGNGVQDPAEDVNIDGSWDALDCQGDSGVAGTNGTGVTWLGTSTTIPPVPNLNDAYYNSTLGISYIWDGTTWQTLAQDGSSTALIAGTGINITGGIINNTGDLDSTNELITATILNGTNIEITENGTLHTIPLASIMNVNDTSVTNEIQAISISNDTIYLSNGGFVQLPTASSLWQSNAPDIYFNTGKVGVGIANPTQQLTVVSPDTVIASFTGSDPDGSIIAVTGINPNAFVGVVFLTGADSGIIGMDPIQNNFIMSNSTVGGHTILGADSTVAFYGEVVGSVANSMIYNQTNRIYNEADSIYSYSSTGTLLNVNQGMFYTDSLYVIGSNAGALNWVLANDGAGQAKWTDPSLLGGSGLWQSNAPNIYFNTGNIGIGTTTPTSPLTINTLAGNEIEFVGGFNANISAPSQLDINSGASTMLNAGSIYLRTASTDRISVLNNGFIGIGTSAPTSNLHVSGLTTTDSLIVNTGAGTIGNVLTDDGTGNGTWQPPVASTSPWTDGGTNIYPTTLTDNVGIGTISPGSELEIFGNAPELHLYSSQTTSAAAAYLRFGDDSGGGFTQRGWVGLPGSGDYLEIGSPQAIFFNTNFGYRMAITSVGNVGIGTTGPTAKLEVSDAISTGTSMLITNNVGGISGSVATFENLGTRSIGNSGVIINNLVTKAGGSNSTKVGLEVNATGSWAPATVNQPTVGVKVTASGSDNNYALQLVDGSQGAGKVLTSDASGFASWQAASSGGAWTSDGTQTYLNSVNDYVGIGTNTPTSALHIFDNVGMTPEVLLETTAGNFNIGYRYKTALSEWFMGQGMATGQQFRIEDVTNGTAPFVIDQGTGNVGIGNSAPNSLLHIKDANTNIGSSQLVIEANSSFGAQSFAALEFRANANAAGVGPVGRIKTFYVNPGYTSATMTFQTIGNGPSFVDAMSLTDGKVGIGTTLPAASLDVNGTFKLTDGTEGAGKVLTSDATGNATWQAAAGGGFWSGGAGVVYPTTLTDNVGIGLTTPNFPLDVETSTLGVAGLFTNMSTLAENYGVEAIANGNGIGTNVGGFFQASGAIQNYALRLVDGTEGAGKVLTSDAVGNASWKLNQVAFYAGNDGSGAFDQVIVAGASDLLFGAGPNNFNIGGGYNTATSTFTAPVSGVYHFDANTNAVGPGNSYVVLTLYVNGMDMMFWQENISGTDGNRNNPHVNGTLYLNATDVVKVQIKADLGGTVVGLVSSFSGHLVYAE